MASAEVVDATELGTEMGEAGHDFGELNVERLRRFVITRQGRDFLLYAGLVSALHAVSDGYFAIDTRIEQLPTAENGQTAVCSARVQVFDYDRPEVVRRVASGIGDASPANVSKLMTDATIRMAETRAKSRALRDLLGIDMVTFEELGPAGADDHPERQAEGPSTSYTPRSPSFPPPTAPRPSETFTIDGRPFTRPQILGVYRQRLLEAQRAGLQLAPAGTQGAPPPEDGPLPAIVSFSSELKRRLEARAGAVRSSGK